jgi:hypothetical protein
MVSDGETFDLEAVKLNYLVQSLRRRVGHHRDIDCSVDKGTFSNCKYTVLNGRIFNE